MRVVMAVWWAAIVVIGFAIATPVYVVWRSKK